MSKRSELVTSGWHTTRWTRRTLPRTTCPQYGKTLERGSSVWNMPSRPTTFHRGHPVSVGGALSVEHTVNFGEELMETSVDKNNPAYRHGHAGSKGFSPTYHSWACMLQRATNERRDCAEHYVSRGILADPRWGDFTVFLADMGERPPGTSLDRIDTNAGYSKGNCRWASMSQQANNKRTTRRVSINGETRSVTEWCAILGLSRNTVWARINKHGFSAYEAITAPKQDRTAAALTMTKKRVAAGKD